MKLVKKTILITGTLMLSACISTAKMDPGPHHVGEKLSISLPNAWNQVNAPNLNGPHAETWTLEGLPVDHLTIYSGLKDGEAISPDFNSKKKFIFKPELQAEQIVALFEGSLTQDGSTFKLRKLEPSMFGGAKSIHFEFSVIRKIDNVDIWGSADIAVVNKQMYAIVYQAPKLTFYPRYISSVQEIVKSAKIG